MAIKHIKLLGALCLLILSSCSLQKRLYNKGFYTSKHHSLKKVEKQTDKDTSATLLSTIKPTDIKEQTKNLDIVAVNDNKPNTVFLLPNTKLIVDCDTLVLRNGTKIFVKVSEVNPDQIKFRYCNASDEPLRTLNKKDISYIVYANGYKEVVEQKPNEIHSYSQQPEKLKTNGFAVAGFVLGLVNIFVTLIVSILAVLAAAIGNLGSGGGASGISFVPFLFPLLLALLSILFCIVSIVQIHQNRDSQEGLAFAIIGLVISVILLAILIAIIIGTM